MTPRKTKDDLGILVGKFLRAQDLGKKKYKLADTLMDQLEKELEPGQVVQLSSGREVRFIDKFAGKNRINVGMNARRYEFEEVVKV